MALAAYRHLLRAARIAFEGDNHLLHAARSQARAGFDNSISLDPSSEEAKKGIEHAEGVAQVLRHNVVQGRSVEGSDVLRKTNLELRMTLLSRRPELRIHKDTERGDNDTVKNPRGKDGKVKVGGI